MSRQARIAVVIALGAVAVAAFVLLRPGGGGGDRSSTTTRPTATTPAVQVVRKSVEVDANGPVGGLVEIRARSGQRVVIGIRSTGYSGEVHLHGFDISRQVTPSEPAVFDIPASRTRSPAGQGAFEMELEAIAVPVARLYVSS